MKEWGLLKLTRQLCTIAEATFTTRNRGGKGLVLANASEVREAVASSWARKACGDASLLSEGHQFLEVVVVLEQAGFLTAHGGQFERSVGSPVVFVALTAAKESTNMVSEW